MFPGPNPNALHSPSLTSARLRLQPPQESDVAPLYALIGGPDREKICAGLLWDGPDSAAVVAGWVARHRTQPYSEVGFAWVIHGPEGAMGTIGLRPHHFPGRALVGYWLGVPFWRQGYITEALTAVLDAAFSRFDLGKIEAEVFAPNTAGRRLVESIGMKQEAMFRRAVLKNGEWLDEAVYGILAEEWLVRR